MHDGVFGSIASFGCFPVFAFDVCLPVVLTEAATFVLFLGLLRAMVGDGVDVG